MPVEVAVVLAVYVAAVLAVGVLARRSSGKSPEEYFLAGRKLGTAVLFMALFGTNTTAFVIVGIPGLAYHDGVGVFGLNAAILALGIPLSFWAVGSPARRLAGELGALTPAELYAKRFGSRFVGLLLFVFFTAYTLPYMVTAIHGAAIALVSVSGGSIGAELGGAAVLAVALVYTSLGGMRGTAWTNVLQGTLFLGFMVAAFFLVAGELGGLRAAMLRVREHDPSLLVVNDAPAFAPGFWASWALGISFTVIAFPHMLVRLMAADGERSLKAICRLYTPALVCLWLPAVVIGVWGAAAVPGLVGRESDRIFSAMMAYGGSRWLPAFGFLAVIAAVMSTLDAQLLTLSSMLTRDVLDPLLGSRRHDDVLSGRLFAVLVAVVVFALWRQSGDSIFDVATVAFSGYVTLTPALFLGVRWKRCTAVGFAASILAGNAVYAWCLWEGGRLTAAREPSFLGLLPVFWAFAAAAAAGVVGSLLSRPRAG